MCLTLQCPQQRWGSQVLLASTRCFPHIIFIPSLSPQITVVGHQSTWRTSHPYGEVHFYLPDFMRQGVLAQSTGMEKNWTLALFYKCQILFNDEDFHFSLDFLRQLVAILCVMSDGKDSDCIWLCRRGHLLHGHDKARSEAARLTSTHTVCIYGFAH